MGGPALLGRDPSGTYPVPYCCKDTSQCLQKSKANTKKKTAPTRRHTWPTLDLNITSLPKDRFRGGGAAWRGRVETAGPIPPDREVLIALGLRLQIRTSPQSQSWRFHIEINVVLRFQASKKRSHQNRNPTSPVNWG